MFNMAAFYVFKAIPGSPWALIRHHEEKGRVQAFTVHNRTYKKKGGVGGGQEKNPENKLQSEKGIKELPWRKILP